MSRRLAFLVSLLACLTARSAAADEVRYTLTDIGRPAHGLTQFAAPVALNGAGQAILFWNLFPNGSGYDFYDPTNGSSPIQFPFHPVNRPSLSLGALGQVAGLTFLPSKYGEAAVYDYANDSLLDLHTALVQSFPSVNIFSSDAVGVNVRGVVAGNFEDESNGVTYRSFVYDPASGFDVLLGDFGPLLGLAPLPTHLRAISATGLAVGQRTYSVARLVVCGFGNPPPMCTIYYSEDHVFAWDGSQARDLGTLGGRSAEAYGVTDFGVIWGVSDTVWQFVPERDPTEPHPFVYFPVRGYLQDMGLLNGFETFPRAANAIGEVIGDNGSQGFIYRNDQLVDLGFLGCNYKQTSPNDINLPGLVVGLSGVAPFSRAFIWDGDHGMRDLTSLTDGTAGQWVVTSAKQVNGFGQITASAVNAQGDTRAVLLEPYPANGSHADVAVSSALAIDGDGKLVVTSTISNARASGLTGLKVINARLVFGTHKYPPLDFYPPPKPCFDPGELVQFTQRYENPNSSGTAAVLSISGTVSGRSFATSQRVRLP